MCMYLVAGSLTLSSLLGPQVPTMPLIKCSPPELLLGPGAQDRHMDISDEGSARMELKL